MRGKNVFVIPIIIGMFLLATQMSFGQVTVKGKVVDQSGEVLIGVNIVAVKTDPVQGTITDIDGIFEITTTAKALEFSYTGYQKKQVAIADIDTAQTTTFVLEFNGNITLCYVYIAAPHLFRTYDATELLTKKNFSINNSISITPVLNQTTGIFMHSGAPNTNRITIRGIGNRSPFGTAKIKAYLDDIPLTNGVGETTLEDLDLEIFENAYVFKDASPSQFGANLGGTIFLNSIPKNSYNKKSTHLSSLTEVGSFGLVKNNLSFHAQNLKENFLYANISQTHLDGYRENNNFDRLHATFLGRVNMKKDQQFSLLGVYNQLKAFIPSSLNEDDFRNNPKKAAFTWAQVKGFEDAEKLLLGLSYTNSFNQQSRVSASIFSTFRDNYESRPFNILEENSTVLGGRGGLLHAFDFGNSQNLTLAFGGEFFHEDYSWKTFQTNDGVQGSILTDNSEIRTYTNLYARSDVSINQAIYFNFGLNFNQTNYELSEFFGQDSIDQSGDYQFKSIFSPYLMTNLNLGQLTDIGDWNIRFFALAAHGFSPPTLEETLTPDGAINTELQPEKGWNFEIGSRGVFNRFSYDLSVYSMQIKDLLVARRLDLDQYIGINAGETVHNGLELELKYFLQNKKFNANIFANYTYADYRFKDFVDGDDDFSNNQLTGTAPHKISAGVAFDFQNHWYGNAQYLFVDAMPMRDDNSIFSEWFHTLNLKLGYKQMLGKKWELDISAGVNNVWDEKYASMILINASSFGGNAPRYYYPGLPVNFYGGLRLKCFLK